MFVIIEDKYIKTNIITEYTSTEIKLHHNMKHMNRLKHDCEKCLEPANFTLYGLQYRIIFFFIPLMKHYKSYYVECKVCGQRTYLELEEYSALNKIRKNK